MAERTHICPDTHRHAQSTTCYHDHGCACDPCRENMTARARERYRLKAYGRYEGRIDPAGVVRRYRGLQLMGWRTEDIAAEIGTHVPGLLRTMRNKWVTPETRDRFAAATGRLAAKGAGPSQITMKRAREKGWVSLLAWDDIDDPNEMPLNVKDRDRGQYDPIAVDLAASGTPVTGLNWAERREVVRRLHAKRWPDTRIGKLLGMDGDSVCRIRRRLGLEAWAYHERATEYGAEHRERGAA